MASGGELKEQAEMFVSEPWRSIGATCQQIIHGLVVLRAFVLHGSASALTKASCHTYSEHQEIEPRAVRRRTAGGN